MKSFKWLLNQVRLSWISLISKVKSFFQTNDTHHQTTASNGNDHTRKISVENTIEEKVNEEDVWYDSLKEQEPGEKERDLDEEEFFDAIENLDEEEVSANIEGKEYEKNKYYSLQDGLQEKNEFDHTTHTLTLAFEIEKPFPDSDLSKFKLCELKQNGDKYTFILENDQKSRIELHSEYLNIYFPKYFEKHSKKGAYTELFSQEENRISNDIIIPLQVPKEASIFTKECNWLIRKVVGEIPDYPVGKSLEYCRSRVNFFLNSNNTISLFLTSAWTKCAAKSSGTQIETNWPVKDILVRGSFINQHIPRVEEAYIDKHYIVEETFEVVNVECASELKISQPSI
ncbi:MULTISPECIES: hypothetical protein [Wolbachia]|uniref:DUF38 domain-containing protein n=1 Tax=Wolbachia endosymbiont of Ephestia elutella TaxID=3231696 RepID=A0AAU8ML45_9RICK|nr:MULTISPECIES: hypothetical protein [Wolbachia]MBS9531757.1 hypothetical protein [Wolbachia endosymbiont of Rhagoletis cerasi]BDG75744.1 hypothetical protein wHmt_03020 [Wolbachia pipientis]BDG77205.1 hypothetical protein wHmc_03370 [Wolbachia pipientis]